MTTIIISGRVELQEILPLERCRRLMAFYQRIRTEHWLRDKQGEGKSLLLEDESSWEIHPADQFITARWLRGSTILVEFPEKGEYPYLLRNWTEGERARANFLGEFRAVS